MVYPTITDNFNLDILNANFLELYNQTNTSSNVAIPPNKILAMPTKPTYSGAVITVYAGTKVSIPNGRNADGTIRNTILTLATDITRTISFNNNRYTLLLAPDTSITREQTTNIIYIDKLSERPTTLPTTSRYYCYCAETNLMYTTNGSLTASWSVSYVMQLGIVTATTVITDLYINDVYNIGQEIDKINVTQSYTPTASNLGTITIHTAMVKSGIGRYSLGAQNGTWTAGTTYTICTLTSGYRPSVEFRKVIVLGPSNTQIAYLVIQTSGVVLIQPRVNMTNVSINIDETYIV